MILIIFQPINFVEYFILKLFPSIGTSGTCLTLGPSKIRKNLRGRICTDHMSYGSMSLKPILGKPPQLRSACTILSVNIYTLH